MTVTDILLLFFGLCFLAAAIGVWRMTGPIKEAVGDLKRISRDIEILRPRIEDVLEKTEVELEELRFLTRNATRITNDVHAVTHAASGAAARFIDELHVGKLPRQYRAALNGAKVGIRTFKEVRSSNDHGTEPVAMTPPRP